MGKKNPDALPLRSYQVVVSVGDAVPVDGRDSDVTARRLRPCVFLLLPTAMRD